jgi:hypothetical protein
MTDDRDVVRPAGGPVRFEATVGGRPRAPAVIVAAAFAFVAAFVVQPWRPATPPTTAAAPASYGPSAAAAVARSATPAPTSGASASERAVEAFCLDPGSWRTATIEQWDSDQTVRVWRAVEPRQATGPTDPAIDVVPAVGETVPAIGYCAPAVGPDRPAGPADVVAWRVDGATATPVELRQMAPIGAVSELGALFAPPLDSAGGWPAGVYVFRHTVIASYDARWFAVEVRTEGPPRDGRTRPPPSAVMQPGGGLGAFFLP